MKHKKKVIIVGIISALLIYGNLTNKLLWDRYGYDTHAKYTSNSKEITLAIRPQVKEFRYNIYQINEDGHILKKWIDNEEDAHGPVFNVDKTRLVYIKVLDYEKGSEIWELDVVTNKRRLLRAVNKMSIPKGYSRDGKKLLFQEPDYLGDFHMGGKIWRRWKIYELNLDTLENENIIDGSSYSISSLNYTKEGNIIFVGNYFNKSDRDILYLYNYKEKKIYPLMETGVSHAQLYDNGTKLMYTSSESKPRFRFKSFDLTTRRLDTIKEIYATDNYVVNASISEDGKKFLIQTENLKNIRRGEMFLFAINLETMEHKKIEIDKSYFEK